MTKKEYTERNIGMTFDFIKQIIDHPEIIDTIPDDAELNFIDKDMPIKTNVRGKREKVILYKVERVFGLIK